jgi:hypothetical protein
MFSTISKHGIDYNGTIGYNKHITQIVFPGEQVFYYYSLSKKARGLAKPFRNV